MNFRFFSFPLLPVWSNYMSDRASDWFHWDADSTGSRIPVALFTLCYFFLFTWSLLLRSFFSSLFSQAERQEKEGEREGLRKGKQKKEQREEEERRWGVRRRERQGRWLDCATWRREMWSSNSSSSTQQQQLQQKTQVDGLRVLRVKSK